MYVVVDPSWAVQTTNTVLVTPAVNAILADAAPDVTDVPSTFTVAELCETVGVIVTDAVAAAVVRL